MVTKTGTAGADNLVGTDANDTLNGLGGNDQLMAGPAKGGTAMTRSSMILKMAALAMLAGSAALPAQASLTNNAIHPNGLSANGLTANAIHPNGLTTNALYPNGVGANSAAGRTFDASRQASGVDVNRLRLRAIVLPGEPGRPTAE
jgi:hypothetical protein